MKTFWKENSYKIVRLIVFQLGIGVLGIITSFATAGLEMKWVYPASSVFCIVFYLFLVFNMCYEDGQKDGIRIESGKIKRDPLKYFVIGFIANSLNLLLGVLALVFRLVIRAPLNGLLSPEDYSPAWAYSLQETFAVIARILHTMYLGVIQAISDRSVLLLVVIPFPAIIVAGGAYLLGIRFKDGFFPKKQAGNQTQRYS